jgi:hypothetical protein
MRGKLCTHHLAIQTAVDTRGRGPRESRLALRMKALNSGMARSLPGKVVKRLIESSWRCCSASPRTLPVCPAVYWKMRRRRSGIEWKLLNRDVQVLVRPTSPAADGVEPLPSGDSSPQRLDRQLR